MVILFPFICKGRKLTVSHKMTKSLTVNCKALTPLRPSVTKVIMLFKIRYRPYFNILNMEDIFY